MPKQFAAARCQQCDYYSLIEDIVLCFACKKALCKSCKKTIKTTMPSQHGAMSCVMYYCPECWNCN